MRRLGWIDTGKHHVRGVGECVTKGLIDRLKINLVFEWSARLKEEITVDGGECKETRSRIESESLATIGSQLAAQAITLLEHGDAMALHGKARGGGESSHATAHNEHGAGHDEVTAAVTGLPFHCVVPRR